MTQEQILTTLRQVISFAGGYAVAQGWLTNDQMVALAGLVPPILAVIWAFNRASDVAQKKSVISQADVKTITKTDGTVIYTKAQVTK